MTSKKVHQLYIDYRDLIDRVYDEKSKCKVKEFMHCIPTLAPTGDLETLLNIKIVRMHQSNTMCIIRIHD